MRISDWSSDVCSSDLSCGTGRYRQVTCLASGIRRIDRRLPFVRLNIPEIPRSSIMPRNPSIKSPWVARDRVAERSAERTSELQSLMRISYDVFCLQKKHTLTDTFDFTPYPSK